MKILSNPVIAGALGLATMLLLSVGCGPTNPCDVNPGSQACLCARNPSDLACVDAMGVAIFHHVRHFNTPHEELRECTTCHAVDPEDQWKTVRPGKDDHKPCKGCHQDFFKDAAAAGADGDKARHFCEACHASAAPDGTVSAPSQYPRPRRERRALLITEFSHANHAGRGLQCEGCHKVEGPDVAQATMPRHDTCAACHGQIERVNMGRCQGCHGTKPQEIRALSFARNQIKFSHGPHLQGVDGPTSCNACHEGMAASTGATDHALPKMAACTGCHGDPAKVPEGKGIDNCALCHTGKVDPAAAPAHHKLPN